ncbi:hypothetical protein [uncultured Fluviicola sp.]|uniref:hypothetical protein n=1 Tax=uncultured Fluviicola sp. TaxID=463303 RepID=UPI0025D40EA5|nr:hypothetical protein [uncultured Fluviicola sp.]
MAFNGNEGAPITPEEAAVLTKRYRDANAPGAITGEFVGKENLLKLLEQPGCMGIRFYYGLDAEGNPEMVLVGADANQNDMLSIIMENTYRCPPFCSQSNVLNSNR